MDSDLGQPIALKVNYRTPELLLKEYGRSVHAGTSTLDSPKEIAAGTRFKIDLCSQDLTRPVEAIAEVTSVRPSLKPGRFTLLIQYLPGADRRGLEEALNHVANRYRQEMMRKHPRVPVRIRATEHRPYSPSYVIRDLSQGGAGLELEAPQIPDGVTRGTPFFLELPLLRTGSLQLHGEVSWIGAGGKEASNWVAPALGLSFGTLRSDALQALTDVLAFRALPAGPACARLSFGADAVARMP
jgi:hypothetical protein